MKRPMTPSELRRLDAARWRDLLATLESDHITTETIRVNPTKSMRLTRHKDGKWIIELD